MMAPSSRFQQIGSYRQLAQSHTGCGVDSVEHGRGQRGGAGLTDAARSVGALDDLDLDDWSLIDPQHLIVVEVRLLTRPFFSVISPYSAAVMPKMMPLCICATTVSGLTTIPVSTTHTTRSHMHLAGIAYRDLGDLGHEASERIVHADSSSAPVTERLAPAGNLCRAI